MNREARIDDAEILRWREAFAALSVDATATPACPPPERLWEAARGELVPDALRDVIDHTAACAACAEAWRMAGEIDPAGASEPALRPADRPRSVPWRRSTQWAALAAAAVLALVVGWQGRNLLGPSEETTFRGSGSRQVVRPLVGGSLPRDAFVLSWHGLEGARYRLRVLPEDMSNLLYEVEDLATTEYRVPEDTFSGLRSGSRIYWSVTATVGGEPMKSDTFDVRLE